MNILKDIDKAEEVLLDLRQQIQNGKKYFIRDGKVYKIYQLSYVYNGQGVFYSDNGTMTYARNLLSHKEALEKLSEARKQERDRKVAEIKKMIQELNIQLKIAEREGR